jgi:hypothetical protein
VGAEAGPVTPGGTHAGAALEKEEMTREEFRNRLFFYMKELSYGERDIAHLFGVSRPTFHRWMVAETSPHPLMQDALIGELEKLLKEREKR